MLASLGAAGDLSPAASRGKQIYLHGTSLTGEEITAYVGANGIPVPASLTPCASCHGEDGTGRPESGVIPTDIRWIRLTKPYGSRAPGGRRRHPAYEVSTVKRAITAGIDPADNSLDPAMPRFRLSGRDLDDLVAYLQELERDLDPGLGEDSIVLATVLPRPRGPGSLGAVVTSVLSSYFDEVNGHGGIHGRRVELVAIHADSPDDALTQARALLTENRVFAFVAAFTGGADEGFADLVEREGVPLIGPLTQSVPADTGTRRFTFYLLSGPEVQGRALVDFAMDRLPDPEARVSVVHPGKATARAVAAAMARQAERANWARLNAVEYPAGDMNPRALAAELDAAQVQALFFVGSGPEFQMLAAALDRIDRRPLVFLQGHLAGQYAVQASPGFANRVFVAFPASPRDQTPAARRELAEFQQRHGLPRRHSAAQIAAFTSAKLLVEGLSQAGRGLSRETLLLALEGLYRYTTGFTRPLSYGPNRRVGVVGAHIVAVDVANGRFAEESTWVQPE